MTFTESERFLAQVSSDHFMTSTTGFLTDCSYGLGAFGEVRMCVHRESGAQRAVKVLRKSHMDDDEKRMLFNEINILKEIVSTPASSAQTLPKEKLIIGAKIFSVLLALRVNQEFYF